MSTYTTNDVIELQIFQPPQSKTLKLLKSSEFGQINILSLSLVFTISFLSFNSIRHFSPRIIYFALLDPLIIHHVCRNKEISQKKKQYFLEPTTALIEVFSLVFGSW